MLGDVQSNNVDRLEATGRVCYYRRRYLQYNLTALIAASFFFCVIRTRSRNDGQEKKERNCTQ